VDFGEATYLGISLFNKEVLECVEAQSRVIDVSIERTLEELVACTTLDAMSEFYETFLTDAVSCLEKHGIPNATELLNGFSIFKGSHHAAKWTLTECRHRESGLKFSIEARMTTEFLEVFFVAKIADEEVYRERVMATIPSDVYLDGRIKRFRIDKGIVEIEGPICTKVPPDRLMTSTDPVIDKSSKLTYYKWSRPISDILANDPR